MECKKKYKALYFSFNLQSVGYFSLLGQNFVYFYLS